MPKQSTLQRVVAFFYLLVFLVFFIDMTDFVNLGNLHERIHWLLFVPIWSGVAYVFVKPLTNYNYEDDEFANQHRERVNKYKWPLAGSVFVYILVMVFLGIKHPIFCVMIPVVVLFALTRWDVSRQWVKFKREREHEVGAMRDYDH